VISYFATSVASGNMTHHGYLVYTNSGIVMVAYDATLVPPDGAPAT